MCKWLQCTKLMQLRAEIYNIILVNGQLLTGWKSEHIMLYDHERAETTSWASPTGVIKCACSDSQ